MEDKKGDLGSPEVSTSYKGSSKNDERATIMILGSSGKVRKFRLSMRFARNALIFFLLYFVVSVLIINNYIKLRNEVGEKELILKNLKSQLYETKIALKKNKEHIAMLQDYVSSLEKRMEQSQVAVETDDQKETKIARESKEIPRSSSLVDVQDMVIQKEGARMTVDFKIVNIKEGNEPVGGYIHIIARREGQQGTRTWTYPEEQLVEGFPKDYKKGQPFLIQRFKPIHGRFQIPPGSRHPTVVIVLVYNHTGDIVLKKEFEVSSVS